MRIPAFWRRICADSRSKAAIPWLFLGWTAVCLLMMCLLFLHIGGLLGDAYADFRSVFWQDWRVWGYLLLTASLLGAGIVLPLYLLGQCMAHSDALEARLKAIEEEAASCRLHMQEETSRLQDRLSRSLPLISDAYLRKLLSGHVASREEFGYIMDYLGIGGERHYFVLYCRMLQQGAEAVTPEAALPLIRQHLTLDAPALCYTTLDHSIVVLVSCSNSETESLNVLQQRVMALHEELSDRHSVWFYAGVGEKRTEAAHLWESYEQARTASRYSSGSHIFIPYEYVRKPEGSWYYPIEISAKLLHFITSGNRDQVREMLALLRRENLEARSLSLPLMKLLLSDLRNTLLKARYQIPGQSGDAAIRLERLDDQLSSPPTFPSLEDSALTLCDFFIRTASPSDPIPEVEAYLRENFADPSLCLRKLSERFNISESYLSYLFKERTGVNFSAFLEKLRMDEAALRLRNGQTVLTTLYSDLGYTNAATFRRAFKKYHGVTPSEMRDRP